MWFWFIKSEADGLGFPGVLLVRLLLFLWQLFYAFALEFRLDFELLGFFTSSRDDRLVKFLLAADILRRPSSYFIYILIGKSLVASNYA